MKRMVWLGVLTLITSSCFAQHGMRIGPASLRGFEHGRFPPPIFQTLKLPNGFVLTPQQISVNLGIPPVSPIPPLGVNMLGVDILRPALPGFNLGFNQFFNRGLGFSGYGYGGYGYGGYPLLPVMGEGYGYGESPNVVFLPPIPMAPPRPPEIAHPALHEYPVPAESASAGGGAQPAFTLAMKDGSQHTAILVWVQDDVLTYVEPSGKTQHVPLNTLDRATTQRLNQEKNLELHLPDERYGTGSA